MGGLVAILLEIIVCSGVDIGRLSLRGFDIPAAIAVIRSQGNSKAQWDSLEPQAQPVYSEGLLIPLALPDFSMPYNVTCFTSTLLAVYLSAMLAAMIRRPRAEAEALAKAAAGSNRAAKLRKAAKMAGVLAVAFASMVALDREMQRTVGEALGVDVESFVDSMLSKLTGATRL
eukprot:scaffold47939_cov48-Prasinocladus_malaysianus.AAC.1